MRITMSDGSADPYQDTMWQRSDDKALAVAYVIDYSAARAAETLTLSWTEAKALAVDGVVGIGSAALTDSP
jgi:hypothetical protein